MAKLTGGAKRESFQYVNAAPFPVASEISFTRFQMDPLSGVASVLTLLAAADVALKSIDRLKGFIRAPEAIEALIDEVQALKGLLTDANEAHELLKQASLRLYQLAFC